MAPESGPCRRVWTAAPCRPDAGVFGLHVDDADPLVALFSHQTVSVELRDGLQRRHQLHHHPGRTLVVTDLRTEQADRQERSAGSGPGPRVQTKQCPRPLFSHHLM